MPSIFKSVRRLRLGFFSLHYGTLMLIDRLAFPRCTNMNDVLNSPKHHSSEVKRQLSYTVFYEIFLTTKHESQKYIGSYHMVFMKIKQEILQQPYTAKLK